MRSKPFIESFDYPSPGWWRLKQQRAKGLTLDELWFARRDCNEAAEAMLENEGKYKDEATIYATEINKRSADFANSLGDSAREKAVKKAEKLNSFDGIEAIPVPIKARIAGQEVVVGWDVEVHVEE